MKHNRTDTDEFHMAEALRQAKLALDNGQFPVGCVLVYENRILATGARKGTSAKIPGELDHAEMQALRRLESHDAPVDYAAVSLYCTLEPCLMCFGAILIRGIGRVVYAYEDAMGGGTHCDLAALPPLYASRKTEVVANVLRQKSLDLFRQFFSNPNNNYWKGSLLADYTLAQ